MSAPPPTVVTCQSTVTRVKDPAPLSIVNVARVEGDTASESLLLGSSVVIESVGGGLSYSYQSKIFEVST